MESATQSFVIKIWLEETAEEAGQVLWRGHITHVPSRRQVYLTRLDQIAQFIKPYLEQMGAREVARETRRQDAKRN
jgi:hypothetical protein